METIATVSKEAISDDIKNKCIFSGKTFTTELGTVFYEWLRYGPTTSTKNLHPLYCSVCIGDPKAGSYQFAKFRSLCFRDMQQHHER